MPNLKNFSDGATYLCQHSQRVTRSHKRQLANEAVEDTLTAIKKELPENLTESLEVKRKVNSRISSKSKVKQASSKSVGIKKNSKTNSKESISSNKVIATELESNSVSSKKRGRKITVKTEATTSSEELKESPLKKARLRSPKTSIKQEGLKKAKSRSPKNKIKQEGESEFAQMAGFIAKGGKFVGAHTSAAGGIWNAVSEAVTIKARAFGLFLKSQRQWQAKPLEDDVVVKFQDALKEHGFHPDFILPHGSYLLNCGSPNKETLQRSREGLLEEVQRCERLGLNRYNFHPGSTCGEISVEECLDLIGESINTVLDKTDGVTIVVENMSCQGNTVGGKFDELRGIIDRVKDKSRIGVCLDTCHAFATGYDLSTAKGFKHMTEDFENKIGFQYLKGVHINDSKGKVGCHLDRHQNIGKGFIGLKGFKQLMNDHRFDNIPMILETPPGLTDAEEIDLLYSLVE